MSHKWALFRHQRSCHINEKCPYTKVMSHKWTQNTLSWSNYVSYWWQYNIYNFYYKLSYHQEHTNTHSYMGINTHFGDSVIIPNWRELCQTSVHVIFGRSYVT